MRSQSINLAFSIMVFTIAVVLAVIFFQKSSKDLCKAAKETPNRIESIGGEMLWESFSSQFSSAVHQ